MSKAALSGAVQALLDEYERAIKDLMVVIEPLSEPDLALIRDPRTEDPDCVSIQTILSHVVHSGYGYTVYMENFLGIASARPPKELLASAREYRLQLQEMHRYCCGFFERHHTGLTIEENDPAKKIRTNWGQQYDIEQLMEHAIVHILRHRRQIERFLAL